jgi:tetratricopeptide (TPR) repeat protein
MSFQSDFYTSVSNMYRILLAMVFMMLPNSIKSQERLHVVKTDSLKYKTFKQLNALSDNAFQNSNTKLLGIYRDYHLKKAKKEHNNLETARAYYSFIGWENLEQDLKYCDSIISITKNSKHNAYPTTGYLLKARLYYFNSDFNKALDNYIIANEWADIKQDKPLQIETTQGIAAIKNIWGLHEEALDIYKSNYADIINNPDYFNTHYDDYIVLANDLSLSYIRNNKPDSALVIAEKAMKQAKLHKDDLGYFDLGKAHATANYYLKKYPQAMDSLQKFSSKYSDLVLSDSYYMMAKIYQYQNRKALAINYFEKIDSIHSNINDAFPELKEVYNELFKYAGEKGNREKQLYYINQLIMRIKG